MTQRKIAECQVCTYETCIYKGEVDGFTLGLAIWAVELAGAHDAASDLRRVCDISEERDVDGGQVWREMGVVEREHLGRCARRSVDGPRLALRIRHRLAPPLAYGPRSDQVCPCSYPTLTLALFFLLFALLLLSGPARRLSAMLAFARLSFSLLVSSVILASTALPVESSETELRVLTPDDFDSTIANGVW